MSGYLDRLGDDIERASKALAEALAELEHQKARVSTARRVVSDAHAAFSAELDRRDRLAADSATPTDWSAGL